MGILFIYMVQIKENVRSNVQEGLEGRWWKVINGNEFIVFGGDVEEELCTDPFAFLCHPISTTIHKFHNLNTSINKFTGFKLITFKKPQLTNNTLKYMIIINILNVNTSITVCTVNRENQGIT